MANPELPLEISLAAGHVLQLRSGPDTWVKASIGGCCLQDLGRKKRSHLWDIALQVNQHMGRVGKDLTEQPWGWAGQGLVALPSTAQTQLAAAACFLAAPHQEAPGFWYFLRVRLAGGHLWSLAVSTS